MRLIDADAFDKCLEDAEDKAIHMQKYVFASALNTIRGNLRTFPAIEPEREEMADLIDRQAAIKKINANLMYLYTYGADRCSELIEELPSVQPEPLWHECVKDDPSSFPDDDRLVLISVENYSDPAIGWYQHDNDGGGYWTFGGEMPMTEFGLFVEGWWELPKKPTLEK